MRTSLLNLKALLKSLRQVSARDEHTSFSGAAVKVDLRTGAAKTVQVGLPAVQ